MKRMACLRVCNQHISPPHLIKRYLLKLHLLKRWLTPLRQMLLARRDWYSGWRFAGGAGLGFFLGLMLLGAGVVAQTPPIDGEFDAELDAQMESAPQAGESTGETAVGEWAQEPPNAARGRLIYAQNCAACHGETGAGDGPVAADLPGPPTAFADPASVRERSPADWFEVTKYGRIEQMMPPWEARLSDREIWQAVYYAWSLHLDETELATAETRYAESCAACHGPQGAGDGPDAPADLTAFDDPVYAASYSPADGHAAWQAAHPEIGADWDEAGQYAVLEQVRTFGYAPPWQPVVLEGEGVIQGQVSMGTSGAELPSELDVRLETYVDFEPIDTVTVSTDDDGSFRFEGLALDPDLVYLVIAGYDGVQYSSPVLTLQPEEPVIDTEIMLYARTDDPGGLYIDRVNWVVEPRPEGLVVGQILTFGARGERTYTGSPVADSPVNGVDEGETWVTAGFYVPPTAQEVSLENGVLGGRYHQHGNLIYDTVPIAPGPATHQVVVRYLVPIDAEPMTLPHEFIYPVRQITLLTADFPQVEVNAPALESLGVQDFQGANFEVWQGEDLAPGAFPVHFSGLGVGGASAAPTTTAQVALLQPSMIFGMGGTVTLLLLAAIIVGWRQGRMRPAQESAGLEAQREYLLRHIARLDDLHAAGALDDESRQQQRAQLKVQLLDVVTRLNALEAEQAHAQDRQPLMQSEAAIGGLAGAETDIAEIESIEIDSIGLPDDDRVRTRSRTEQAEDVRGESDKDEKHAAN